MRDDTFYGNIVVEANGRTLNIDARPSDALALAVRTRAPIFVARLVMESVGITPEEDMQDDPQPKATAALTAAPAEAQDGEEDSARLSVFEDFLQKLDLGDLDKDEPEEDNKD